MEYDTQRYAKEALLAAGVLGAVMIFFFYVPGMPLHENVSDNEKLLATSVFIGAFLWNVFLYQNQLHADAFKEQVGPFSRIANVWSGLHIAVNRFALLAIEVVLMLTGILYLFAFTDKWYLGALLVSVGAAGLPITWHYWQHYDKLFVKKKLSGRNY